VPRRSAGILFHRVRDGAREILLVHPGGPFWRGKDVGAWQIPKGEIDLGEDTETAAQREVLEELGVAVTSPLIALGEIRQAGGKVVTAFAAEQDVDVAAIVSNTVEIVWPPRSDRRISVPEVDEARWMTIDEARSRMLRSQLELLDRLDLDQRQRGSES
jgi:predicted NUDIX family NTP pyrophosphohydrolase